MSVAPDREATPVLELKQISKRFGAVAALSDVTLCLKQGEILALLGDNGAGKSTLIKCISGVHSPDAGEMILDGSPVRFRKPAEARAAGIETVYQDLALFDNLRVDANFYAGRELARPRWLKNWGLLRKSEMTAHVRELVQRLRVTLPSGASTVGVLSGGQRQCVAVARAAAFANRIVVLDEPTAALGVRESAAVLDTIREFPSMGISVIYVSHNLDHVVSVADRAVVLRRGRLVGEAPADDASRNHLVSLIVAGN